MTRIGCFSLSFLLTMVPSAFVIFFAEQIVEGFRRLGFSYDTIERASLSLGFGLTFGMAVLAARLAIRNGWTGFERPKEEVLSWFDPSWPTFVATGTASLAAARIYFHGLPEGFPTLNELLFAGIGFSFGLVICVAVSVGRQQGRKAIFQ